MEHINKKILLSFLGIAAVIGVLVFVVVKMWNRQDKPLTLQTELESVEPIKDRIINDFNQIPTVQIGDSEDGKYYQIKDDGSVGLEIHYADQQQEEKKADFSVNLPKNYAEPVEIKLDNQRSIFMEDKNSNGIYTKTLTMESPTPSQQPDQDLTKIEEAKNEKQYIKYQTKDDRKALYYGYQKEQTSGERKLKNWLVYKKGNGHEEEAYAFKNAKLKLNEDGEVEVYYFSDQDQQNQQAMAEVDPSLLERAQKVVAEDLKNSNSTQENKTPDFIIPRPFFIDKYGTKDYSDWLIDDVNSTIAVELDIKTERYPIALDPTLSFTAPMQSNTATVINGEGTSELGIAIDVGDYDADGKNDLVVGADIYNSSMGRVYIFFSQNISSKGVIGADVIINGETSSQFGIGITSGDFNSDGRTDLAVGADIYSSNTGRAYIFYNDGKYPDTATSADAIVTGASSSRFGRYMESGDFNSDGKADLVVSGYLFNSEAGRAYVFNQNTSGGFSASFDVSVANVIISGEASSRFGSAVLMGDMNSDGKNDLIIGAYRGVSYAGRVYIFYQNAGGGFTTPLAATSANSIITGESSSYLGLSLALLDYNSDGKIDLVVGAFQYNSYAGRVYVFNQNSGGGFASAISAGSAASSYTNGETGSYLGYAMTSGDFNHDGKDDVAVGGYVYNSNAGRTYILYNDSSFPTSATTADVIIGGEAASYFGIAMTSGDLNKDGSVDLIVGAMGYNTNVGRVYIFYSQNGMINTNQNISGESGYFGSNILAGDFNSDGREDLAVGAYGYSSSTGRVYIFYNDGFMSASASSADVIITGQATSSNFGDAMDYADLNSDGKGDLVVGAQMYSTQTGRAYIFYGGSIITEGAGSADVIISGESTNNNFGFSFETQDFNSDGKTDLAVGAKTYSTYGRTYIFYQNSGGGFTTPLAASSASVRITGTSSVGFGTSIAAEDFNADGKYDLAIGGSNSVFIFYQNSGGGFTDPSTDSSANVTITGESSSGLGSRIVSGDFNSDGKNDLAVGAYTYTSNMGRAYIFYNDGSIPTAATSADVIITGESGSYFGKSMTTGDFNQDGRKDLAIGGYRYSTYTGKAYIFHNDGSIPTTAGGADVAISGENTSDYLGVALFSGDFNADGKADLAIGASGYNSNAGRVYIYQSRSSYSWQIIPQKDKVRTTPIAGQEIVLSGEGGSFSTRMSSGDFNSDGKIDLAISAPGWNTNWGRAYLFYNDGIMQSADAIIDGASSGGGFGIGLTSGDFDFDGDTDLAVGAQYVGTNAGAAYLFYNKGLYPVSASDADLTITGEASSYFGFSLSSGDFNADGRVDLAVGAHGYSSNAGRAYVFNNDGSYPTTAATANAIITGESGSYFGFSMINGSSGDFNKDGKTDLVVSTPNYSSSAGRLYIFNGGSVVTEAATGADVIITGQLSSNFGISSTAGDFNNDGFCDLAVGANYYSTFMGRAYIFYAGSVVTEAATGADVIIAGESSNSSFGYAVASGDFNFDGKTDLAVGGDYYYNNSMAGRNYVFYGDGSIPTTAATADVIIDGETGTHSGNSLASGDFNFDGHADLAIGAYGYNSNAGKVSIYTFNDSATSGESTSNYFGYSLITGDFNTDGNTDLAIGAYGYSSNTGRAYIFYGLDAKMPINPAANKADAILTGPASSQFGYSLGAGDYNSDGKIDLAIGANVYSSNAGYIYLFYQPSSGGYASTLAYSSANSIINGSYATKFGKAIVSADFNSDGKTDLAVSENEYSTNAGRVYVFNQNSGGGFSNIASTSANYFINGEASSQFGYSLITDDFNGDGKADLIAGAIAYSSSAGRAYVFHQNTAGGFTTSLAATSANTIINGEASSYFGSSLAITDFNADGKKDLAAGASAYNSSAGRAYIFSNDGSIPTTAATADIKIDGESGSALGASMANLDINVDGKADLIIGGSSYSTNTGRVYVFHNRGTDMIQKMPTSAANADMLMTGETTNNYFGNSLATGDINNDGRSDLIIGAYGYSTNTGKVYTYATEASYQSNEKSIKFQGTSKYQGTVKFQ